MSSNQTIQQEVAKSDPANGELAPPQGQELSGELQPSGGLEHRLTLLLRPETEQTPLVSAVYSENCPLFDEVLATIKRCLPEQPLTGSVVRAFSEFFLPEEA